MGLMIAKYLRQGQEDRERELEDSLRKYTEYVLRELVDADSGQVFNDIGKDDSYKRLYNLPWYAAFSWNCIIYMDKRITWFMPAAF